MGFPKCASSVFRSEGGMRRGYMGHLTRIANTVVHNLEKGPVHTQISSLITGVCIPMWKKVTIKKKEFVQSPLYLNIVFLMPVFMCVLM